MDAVWMTTRTGLVYHAFKADDSAICRGNIKAPGGVTKLTEGQVDARLAEAWGARVLGFRKCESCAKSMAAFQARLAASLEPSTGEGDYLPPARENDCCDHAPAYHGARGCDECTCTVSRFSETTPTPKETQMTERTEGPLTERQVQILERTMTGARHKQIAFALGTTVPVIRVESRIINDKMGTVTTAQAVAEYATADAYRNAAAQLLGSRIVSPLDDAERHVNHVLEGISKLFRDWSDQRLPR